MEYDTITGLLDYTGLQRYTANANDKFSSAILFDVVIENTWGDRTIYIEDERFLPNENYVYLVLVSESYREIYMGNNIRPMDVEIEGVMGFICDTVPSKNISVSILRLKLSNGGVSNGESV